MKRPFYPWESQNTSLMLLWIFPSKRYGHAPLPERPEQFSEQNAKKKTEIEKHDVPKVLPPFFIWGTTWAPPVNLHGEWTSNCYHGNWWQEQCRLQNIGARRYSPFAVFFDLDSVLEKVETVRNNPTCSRTTVIEKHKPSSFFLVVVEAGNPKPVFFFHFIEWWTRWLNSFECWKYRRVTFVIKYDDTRTTSEAPLFLKTVTNSGFAKRNSPKLTRKYWTIIISMDHSSDGLTTDATSNSFVVKVKAWYILKTPSSVFLYNFSVT